jgi:hypothetical protein
VGVGNLEEWQKHFWQIVSRAGKEIEQFVQDIDENVTAATAELVETLASAIERVDDAFLDWQESEDDQFHFPRHDWDREEDTSSFVEPSSFESDFYDIYYLESSPEHQPACLGCRHYHGRVYGKNLLVCAMHPHGWQEDRCPDWES